MYSLDVIESEKYQTAKKPVDHLTRNCSFCFSVRGVVLHSGAHRSTAFIGIETPLFHEFRYWVKQEQEAIDGFITACVGDYCDEACHENACKKARPGWTFKRRKSRFSGIEISCTRPSGKLVEHFTASDWREAHYLTK
jgi:hypothetical protein